jgi:hypothetical protein
MHNFQPFSCIEKLKIVRTLACHKVSYLIDGIGFEFRTSVVDRHRVDADPDPNIYVDADPDPGIGIKLMPIFMRILPEV